MSDRTTPDETPHEELRGRLRRTDGDTPSREDRRRGSIEQVSRAIAHSRATLQTGLERESARARTSREALHDPRVVEALDRNPQLATVRAHALEKLEAEEATAKKERETIEQTLAAFETRLKELTDRTPAPPPPPEPETAEENEKEPSKRRRPAAKPKGR